jgi:diguanylate cyclase (GGDEF)-like protein
MHLLGLIDSLAFAAPHISTWFDNRTLLACQAFSTALFGCGLLGMHLWYPRIPGVRTMATAFLIGCPASILIAMQGVIHPIFSMALGNACIYLSYLLMYRGLTQYFRDRSYLTFAWIVYTVACLTHLFFTIGYPNLMVRIVIASVTLTTLRILIITLLIRNADGNIHRKIFAGCVTLFTAVGLLRTPLTLIHGAPQNFMHQNTVQTYMLLMGLAFLAVDGSCYIILVGSEIARTIKQNGLLDPLTQVLNRRGIDERLREELDRSARMGTLLSILLIDLDHFKSINDTLGHAAGDDALRRVASAIAIALRPYDFLGRYGGDEFLLILPGTQRDDALSIALRFVPDILTPTLSIGIADCEPGESATSILGRADRALYRAKAAGRNCIRLDAPLLDTAANEPTPNDATMV